MEARVKIINGESAGIPSREFRWTSNSAFCCATNFADGLALGLSINGLQMLHPEVPQLDGYEWWHKSLAIRIVVTNKNGEIVRAADDCK